jgi:hypothetical protein
MIMWGVTLDETEPLVLGACIVYVSSLRSSAILFVIRVRYKAVTISSFCLSPLCLSCPFLLELVRVRKLHLAGSAVVLECDTCE